MTEIKDR